MSNPRISQGSAHNIVFLKSQFCVTTRLSSIESQPKKVVVVVAVVFVFVVVIVVGHKILSLKFGQNWGNNK